MHSVRIPTSGSIVREPCTATGSRHPRRVAARHVLAALGIEPGDHVALSCPNLPYFPIAYFGILKAGAVVVPLNVLLKPREIAYHLKDSDAKALIAFEGSAELPLAAMAKAACDEAKCPNLVLMTVAPDGASPVPGTPTLSQLIR